MALIMRSAQNMMKTTNDADSYAVDNSIYQTCMSLTILSYMLISDINYCSHKIAIAIAS